jgi:hypothetical protein
MSDADKIRENHLRRVARRRGLNLTKSRRRDPQALDYGHYWITNPYNSNALVLGGEWGADLDEVEEFLTRRR